MTTDTFYKHDAMPQAQRASTLALGGAIAVIIVTAVGIGAATGVIPSHLGDAASEAPVVSVTPVIASVDRTSSCVSCGTVTAIRAIEIRPTSDRDGSDEQSGTAASILSAAGGIFSGHDFQTTVRKRYAYRVTLRMDDGSYRTVSESSPARFSVGQKVRLVDGTLAAIS